MSSRSIVVALTLALASVTSGCLGAAAVAGAGYLVAREVGPDQRPRADLAIEIEEVWFVAEGLLAERAEGDVGRYEKPRRLVARVDGATIEVTVEWTGPEATRVSILAQRSFAQLDTPTADALLDELLARLEARNPGL